MSINGQIFWHFFAVIIMTEMDLIFLLSACLGIWFHMSESVKHSPGIVELVVICVLLLTNKLFEKGIFTLVCCRICVNFSNVNSKYLINRRIIEIMNALFENNAKQSLHVETTCVPKTSQILKKYLWYLSGS